MAQKEGWKMDQKRDVTNSRRSALRLPAATKTGDGGFDLIPNALFYENRHPNSGGITVIYDLDAGRLFVEQSHR